MKKCIAIMLLAVLVSALMASCNTQDPAEQPEPPTAAETQGGEIPETEPTETDTKEEDTQLETRLDDISAEYSLSVDAEYILVDEEVEVKLVTDSPREVTVQWRTSDRDVLKVKDGVASGVSKGEATIIAKISAEGCEEFTLTYVLEVKPADYTVIPFGEFVMITDLSREIPKEAAMATYVLSNGKNILSHFKGKYATIKSGTSALAESPYEFIVGKTEREESISAGDFLKDGEYSIRSVLTEDGMKVLINATDEYTMVFAFETLADHIIVTEAGAFVPSDLDILEKPYMEQGDYDKIIIETDTSLVRDPCIVYHEGLYYMIGTRSNTEGYCVATSEDLIHWSDPVPVNRFSDIPDYAGDCWAPELHLYKGSYYITATYKSSKTGHRGCAIFKADSPLGPFRMITDGHITSSEWNAIDGTLYVDEAGDPWFIYVREWVTAPDQVGTFEAVRLSEDLTQFVSEPVELFRADDPWWACHTITDGCWLYKMESTGSLIMLWSNADADGYCIAMARSKSGNILGPWEQIGTRLYSGAYTETDEGGHGALFQTKDGQLMLSFHAPDDALTSGGNPHAFLMPLEEDPEKDMLVPKK